MKIKSISLILLIFSFVSFLTGQSVTDSLSNTTTDKSNIGRHEVGVVFAGLTDFNFVYKRRIKENLLFRISVISASFDIEKISEDRKRDIRFQLAFGLERRRQIKNKLFFIHGIDSGVSYRHFFDDNPKRTTKTFTPSIGYLLGLHYNLSKRFYLNGAIIPAIQFQFNYDENPNEEPLKWLRVFGGFNSNFAYFTLGYRI